VIGGGSAACWSTEVARVLVPGARHWPLAALVLASALWGCAVAGTKYAPRAFDPVTLPSVELVAATAALWADGPERPIHGARAPQAENLSAATASYPR